MFVLKLAAAVIVGYLCGSVNSAIIVTRLVRGSDIRTLGNENPGTANVARNVGKGWAAVVFFLDVAKAIIPMIVLRSIFFHAHSAADTFAVFATGIAAAVGHSAPLYFGFKGGGALATTFGVISFFVPVELAASMLLSFAIIRLVVKEKEYRLGRWVGGLVILLVPLVTTLSTLIFEIPIAGRIGIGTADWSVVGGVVAAAAAAVLINLRLFGGYLARLFGLNPGGS